MKLQHQKNSIFAANFALLVGFFWYWCYYPHRLKDALFPVRGIFSNSLSRGCYSQGYYYCCLVSKTVKGDKTSRTLQNLYNNHFSWHIWSTLGRLYTGPFAILTRGGQFVLGWLPPCDMALTTFRFSVCGL